MARRVDFPIVGVGASAGGLKAFTRFLGALPAKPDMAFVYVQHLFPRAASHLPEILAKVTAMPVEQARHGARILRNHVYVIPPDKEMEIIGGELRLLPRRRAGVAGYRAIDLFLFSLARDRSRRAVAVILSGEASDGTLGIQAVRAAGGFTLAQDRASADHPSMPVSAAAAGGTDFVGPPEAIARELLRIRRHPYLTGDHALAAPGSGKKEGSPLETIFSRLLVSGNVDFAQYKRSMVLRRIHRRMAMNRHADLEAYAKFLERSPVEAEKLFADLLIHVTSFFREPAAFKSLEAKGYPAILKERGAKGPLRIWIPGCATGEEAYSHAINLLEYLRETGSRVPVQVFATDVAEPVIQAARKGVFAPKSMKGVSAERKRRFFVKQGGAFRVTKEVRDVCVFARHDVLRDPPFSNMDLVSCRNLMIYVGPGLQKRMIAAFRYALRPGGVLLLGRSESVGGSAQGFVALDKKNKLFQAVATAGRPAVASFSGADWVRRDTPPTRAAAAEPEHPAARTGVRAEVERILLARYAPAAVVVDAALEVRQFYGATEPFLNLQAGTASLNLLRLARDDIRPGLRAALKKASGARTAEFSGELVGAAGESTTTLSVIPLEAPDGGGLHLVLFERSAPPASETARGKRAKETSASARLRKELAATRAYLRTALEGVEETSEKLRAANQEVVTSNEELQSANEELETAQEELQSTNEELNTLNDELNHRNNELTGLNTDLHSLLASVDIPTLIVDDTLRIKLYTPSAVKLLNILPSDVGRPLSHLKPALALPDLRKLAREALESSKVQRCEVRDAKNHWFSLVVRPYAADASGAGGVVIALIDIDQQKLEGERISQAKRIGEKKASALIHLLTGEMPGLFAYVDAAFRHRSVNARYAAFFGQRPGDLIGRKVRGALGRAFADAGPQFARALSGEKVELDLRVMVGAHPRWMHATLVPDFAGKRKVRGFHLLGQDVTAVREEERKFQTLFESAPCGILMVDSSGKIVLANPRILDIFGYAADELTGKSVAKLFPPSLTRLRDSPFGRPVSRPPRFASAGKTIRGRAKDGRMLDLDVGFRHVRTRGLTIATVVDAAQRLEANKVEKLRENELFQKKTLENLSHELKTPLASIRLAVETLMRGGASISPRETSTLHATIQDEAKGLTKSLENLLQLAKLGVSERRIKRATFSLSAMVQSSVRRLLRRAARKGLRVRSTLAKGLRVSGDRALLVSGIDNVLANAVAYTPSGGRIDVALSRGGASARLKVRDSGIGIPAKDLERIFERFERTALSRRYRNTGSGLGLAITKEAAAACGGTVRAERARPKGSRFILTLPLAGAAARDPRGSAR